ncbi:MAG TPA: MFS transporter [Nocardioidaceae bacterium]|nr:MFS transporter [Nocardioidaceae bacterium]
MHPTDPPPDGAGGRAGDAAAGGSEQGRSRTRARLTGAGRAVRRGAGGAARGSGTAARVAGRLTGRGARSAFVLARRASHAEGAGESGLSRLVELHAFNAAGDAAVAIALAGTLFFQVPTGEARGQVALFLLLTMLPFAIVAPLIGPFLDRFRRGRRWAIGATMALRAFLCWVLATAVVTDSVVQFPAALGVLVASKAYGVTRASAVPRLVPRDLTLVKTNSRVSLAGVAGATVSAPLAGGLSLIGPEWTLRYAFVVFVGGTILAVLLPSRVDSATGEDSVSLGAMAGGRRDDRRLGINPLVVAALRSNAGLRGLSGFLIMFMAFLLRDQPFAGWEDDTALLLGLVVGAAGLGSTLGTVLGNWLRAYPPGVIVVAVLALDAMVAVAAAVFYGLVLAVALALTAGLCQQLGKLSLDATIQDAVPENVRTSVFARSETLLQLSWVLGGGLGIAMPLQPRLGLGIIAGLLVLWLVFVLRGRASLTRRAHRQPT